MDAGDLGYKVAEILLPLLVAGLTWASAKLAAYINAKVKNEYLKGVYVRLDDAVLSAVKEAQQVVVPSIRAANADGKITDAEKEKIKADVLAVVKSHLGLKGLAEIGKVLGLNDGTLTAKLSSKIEAAVYDVKAREAAIANPPGLVPG